MRIFKALRANRDVPFGPIGSVPAAAAGTSADFTLPLMALANLGMNASAGTHGDVPTNYMNIRWVLLVFGAALTGVATNNATFNLLQYRNGSVFATLATITFAAGTNASPFVPLQLKPAIFNNVIAPNDVLAIQRVSNGTGLATPQGLVVVEWAPAGPH